MYSCAVLRACVCRGGQTLGKRRQEGGGKAAAEEELRGGAMGVNRKEVS